MRCPINHAWKNNGPNVRTASDAKSIGQCICTAAKHVDSTSAELYANKSSHSDSSCAASTAAGAGLLLGGM